MNLEKFIQVYKNIGETPLEALEKVRREHGFDTALPMTYAGRLDPMAEGLLIVLVGEECKEKDQYTNLEKEYEVEVLFGFKTDTGDLLGKIEDCKPKTEDLKIGNIKEILKSLTGKFVQEYPVFSSKTVEGEPLFALAKSGSLPETLPTKEVEIYRIDLIEQKKISGIDLLTYIETNIAKVKGDFRQEEVLALWQDTLSLNQDFFDIVKIKVSCSSGTYMRSLARRLGDVLAIPALAFSIKRTKVGEFYIS